MLQLNIHYFYCNKIIVKCPVISCHFNYWQKYLTCYSEVQLPFIFKDSKIEGYFLECKINFFFFFFLNTEGIRNISWFWFPGSSVVFTLNPPLLSPASLWNWTAKLLTCFFKACVTKGVSSLFLAIVDRNSRSKLMGNKHLRVITVMH